MSLGLNLYLNAARRAGQRALLPAGEKRASIYARPAGVVLWLHVSSAEEIPPVQELIRQFADEMLEVSFLVTLPQDAPATIRFQQLCIQPCLQIEAPADTPQQVAEFLDHWRPVMAIWVGAALRPALVIGTSQRAIPLTMVNARSGAVADTGNFWNRGMIRPVLGHFSCIIAASAKIADQLVHQGADPDSIMTSGLLQEGPNGPHFKDSERDNLAVTLASRPVWLASGSSMSESKIITEAHRVASRLSHRLLLVITAVDADHGAVLAMVLKEDGWRISRHSLGEMPEDDTQIFIADTGEDSALWLSISQVCFLGNSLNKGGNGCAPFAAMALGAAILHGRYVSDYSECYSQLDAAGAARMVHTTSDLSTAVQELLAPDKAAEMAHAGWEIISTRAGTTRRVIDLIQTRLDTRESA